MATTATAQKQPDPKPAIVSRLGKVQKGQLRSPLRFMFYGEPGVGKSTLASAAPDPIWFDVDDGSGSLNVPRYPFRDELGGHVPRSYTEFLSGIDDLATSQHVYKTIVIDKLDRLEALIWQHMIARDSQASASNKQGEITSVESYGYGKGFNLAVDEWRALCARLDRLRASKGMSVIFLGDALVKQFKNPTGPDFDRFQIGVNDKAASFLKGWMDVTGFLCHEDGAAKPMGEGKHARAKGFSTGRRLLKFNHTAAFDAKSRIELPDEVEVDIANPWEHLTAAIAASYENELATLGAQIVTELARIQDDELTGKVTAFTKSSVEKEDAAALARALADLKKRPSKDTQ